MKPLRTAIIGCGGIARAHAGRLAELEDVQLVGLCDRAPERAIAFNEQYAGQHAQVYEDYARLYEELDLDLVYICLPPFAHDREVELACRHGIHFLIEKPIALTLELAESMAAWVEKSGVKAQVGFMFRHGEAVRWLKQYMRDAGAAESGFLTARYFCNALHSGWWRDRSKSGGQLVEQIIHLFDLARYLLGEPARVYAMQANLFHRDLDDYTVEDASGTVVRFQSGALGVFAATNGAIPNRWDYDLRVMVPGLTADFEDANQALFHHTAGVWPATTAVESQKDILLAETLDLIAAIRENRPPAVPIQEGVRSLRFVLAAAASAEQDAPVDILPG